MLLHPTAHISPCPGHVSPPPMDFDSSLWGDDRFRMYEFKVRTCARGRSHDWTKCPYAHAGEKARRRDPRNFNYSATECPDSRHGVCTKGDACDLAHGTFEIWLHPDRYRTQPCRDGIACRRRICFFAHTPDQLRIPAKQSLRSPRAAAALSSPTSTLFSPLSESPPLSPVSPVTTGDESFGRLVAWMQKVKIVEELKRSPAVSGFGSSLRRSSGGLDGWDMNYEEEPAMERVESGRNIRAQMYAKLMRENSMLILAGSRS